MSPLPVPSCGDASAPSKPMADAVELAANLRWRSNDVKANTSGGFVKRASRIHGQVTAAYIGAVKDAGFTDAQIGEIVLLVAFIFLTNLIDDVAETDAKRLFHWPQERRPDDHPGLTQLGL